MSKPPTLDMLYEHVADMAIEHGYSVIPQPWGEGVVVQDPESLEMFLVTINPAQIVERIERK